MVATAKEKINAGKGRGNSGMREGCNLRTKAEKTTVE